VYQIIERKVTKRYVLVCFATFLFIIIVGECCMNQDSFYWFVMDNALEMIFSFGDSGVITYANAAAKETLEYGEALCGTHISAVFPNTFHVTWGGFKTDFEFGEQLQDDMAYRKNRTCFHVELKIIKSGHVPDLYVCMATDITKRDFFQKEITRVTQEAEQAAKVKSEFVANVTHELRTPVNGIQGNMDELLSMEMDAEKLRIMNLIERGCRDMHSIINNILDFSKLEAGKFTLEMRRFHFRNMMDYVKSNHINKITEKGLEFFVTISPEVPEYIIGDELRIVQVLNNLLSNACKFTSIGKIAVEAVKTAQVGNRAELFFIVIDSGIGIDKAGIDKLYKSFSQVDASISRKYGGTGLGLNISKQLVELMGGNIGVESEPGKGTMFTFSIWVEIPDDELSEVTANVDMQTVIGQMQRTIQDNSEENVSAFGTAKNLEEIKNKMSKLILSVEMDNWEKAETFMEIIRELTAGAPQEVKHAALKLKMAVQKGNYERAAAAYEMLQKELRAVKED